MSTAITTMTEVVTRTASPSASASADRAPPQGGVLEGANPSEFDPHNPIILFIIQAAIIIIFCRLLHWPLSQLRQPRVIAEVIGGILLGPSVMGRIPGFQAAIFPTVAMPELNLVANIGLVLFLFLVGLEVDLRFLVSNWKVAVSVGLAGMALPFGLGCAIAWGLYHEFREEPGLMPINFGVYMLFIGVAMAITAFPVLCRILTELKLLQTDVGVIVLSAGVGNDVVGWILLALCVALVNTGSGLTALWVLLVCVGYALFLVYAVRPAFLWVLNRTRALQDGPSQSVIALTLLLTLSSAFFTGIIGVHPIFGAFMVGLICPHEGGFAIKVTEKIEDLVSALFLPLYFALSGLSTNLGLLNDGITWAYVIGVISVAFFAKFIGATLAARVNGLLWRESFTIGSLMSCKGLVELIVLNIGLQAKILSQRTFTIFVVMALVTTFITTPLTAAFYPPWYQKKVAAWKRGEIDWDSGLPIDSDNASTRNSVAYEKLESSKIQKVLVYLRLDNMPTLLAFMSLLGGNPEAAVPKTHPSRQNDQDASEAYPTETEHVERPVLAHGVRLVELTERDSSVMKVTEVDEFSIHDPIVNTFRTFGRLHNLAVSGEVVITPESGFADSLLSAAGRHSSDLILLPWTETGSMSEAQIISSDSVRHKLETSAYTSFINNALNNAACTTAVFINKNFGGSATGTGKDRPRFSRTRSASSLHSSAAEKTAAPISDRSHHIFAPFFGGVDDRVAVRLVLQMAENTDVTATIFHFETPASYFADDDRDGGDIAPIAEATSSSSPLKPTFTTPGKEASTTATPATPAPSEKDAVFISSLRASLPASLSSRVAFSSLETSTPFADALAAARREVGQQPRNAGDLIVVGRGVGRASAFGREEKEKERDGGEAARCLGVLGERVVRGVGGASVLVVQARGVE
ncbi:K(+)/H(+) antiporter-like protein 1 [Aulographum hederae CBS 113979]|uniref:K(+)/H(+) antiporter-like protein 1 n=1 Tax=Aulographum hederae CBS 113979 TaxID=1176131 RepID=A0A6G1HBA1_9PEZI|nr:K(+)/H(+) antiporter-like protein 1 [Aulographum hederae CBS 113979]